MLRYSQATVFLIIFLCAAIFLNIAIGAESLRDIFMLGHWDLLLNLRAPRILTALGAGAAVAVAGVLSQALFRNALATPSIIGTEAGACFGLAVSAITFGLYAGQDLVMVSTILGAAVATVMTLGLSSGEQSMTRLLLGGFALNAFLAALTAMITSWLMESGQGLGVYHWLLGSFSARTWPQAIIMAMTLVVTTFAALQIAMRLDLLALGDDGAKSSGIRVGTLRKITFILMAILVGTSVSVGGALPFVGLVVPHFIRLQTGPQIRPLILNSALGGASLVVLADLIARTFRAPVETDVGLLTTLIGAPYFLWLLKRETTT